MESIEELCSILTTASLMLKSGNNINDLEQHLAPLFHHPLCLQACIHIVSSSSDLYGSDSFYVRFLTAKVLQKLMFVSWERVSVEMQASIKQVRKN